jgi:hypothetical protein
MYLSAFSKADSLAQPIAVATVQYQQLIKLKTGKAETGAKVRKNVVFNFEMSFFRKDEYAK